MQPIVVLYLLWVLWFLTWLAAAIAGDPGPRKVRGPFLFVYRLVILASTLLLFTISPWPGLDVQYRLWERTLSEETGWALTAIVTAGFMLAWWATLSCLVAGRRQNGVVDRGPYRFVRHPAYLGLIVVVIATAVTFGRPSSAAGALLLVAAFLAKILVEERALRDEEPAYDEYMERVPMLLPIPKPRETAKVHASMQRVLEPTASPGRSEPKTVLAIPETTEPSAEPAPRLPVQPAQLKLSLDVTEKSNRPALSGADFKP